MYYALMEAACVALYLLLLSTSHFTVAFLLCRANLFPFKNYRKANKFRVDEILHKELLIRLIYHGMAFGGLTNETRNSEGPI